MTGDGSQSRELAMSVGSKRYVTERGMQARGEIESSTIVLVALHLLTDDTLQ